MDLRRLCRVLLVAPLLALLGFAIPSAAADDHHGPRPTIVLVHGAFADGSSWSGVITRLEDKGYNVVAPPNPLRGPVTDAPDIAAFLQTIPGPIVLVGHSYGGFVITDAATGNPNVKALVYVDALIPDQGEVAGQLIPGSCFADAATSFHFVPTSSGLDIYANTAPNPPYTGIAECFANGLSRERVAIVAATQRPIAAAAFGEPSGVPAWKTIPSWAVVGTADHVIPAAQLTFMATRAGSHIVTVDAGHLVLVSNPGAVARAIVAAANATS